MPPLVPPPLELHDLPEHILAQIALRLNVQDRRKLLPGLSRGWKAFILGQGVYVEVSINTDAEFSAHRPCDINGMHAWFGNRAGQVKVLRVEGWVQRLPSNLLGLLLISQCHSLLELHIQCWSIKLTIGDVRALLALQSLQKLIMQLPMIHSAEPGLYWTDNAAYFLGVLSQLPALSSLQLLSHARNTPSDVMAKVEQLQKLQSPKLAAMSLSMASAPHGTLTLPHLPALESCELDWINSEEGHVLDVTPTSFSGATALTRLFPGHRCGLRMALSSFGPHSMLAVLGLYACNLTTIPAALAGLRGSLRQLDLSCNPGLQLWRADFVGFSRLESLNLSYCGLREIPAPLLDLQHSLQRLDLDGNPLLQISEAGSTTLLWLHQLQWLSIRASDGIWEDASEHRIIQFPGMWRAMRPAVPVPVLCFINVAL